MPIRRYEMTNEQWEQIKDWIPKARTGRPPKDKRATSFLAFIYLAAIFILSK